MVEPSQGFHDSIELRKFFSKFSVLFVKTLCVLCGKFNVESLHRVF